MATDDEVELRLADRPESQQPALQELREVLRNGLPAGFSEVVQGTMLAYVVPHTLYPAGYHANPEQPLPFISLAGKKSGISLYHFGVYATPEVEAWFRVEYPKHTATKLDMGKSCIRFNKPDQIPFVLIGELATRITLKRWIALYEATIRQPSKRGST